MRFNDKALSELSNNIPVIEGRLHHKRLTSGNFAQSGFKERWCKLISNILFFFHLSETGKIHETKPVGALVLEHSFVQYESDSEAPFAFALVFKDETDKKHVFSGRSEEYINEWVKAMKCASYEYWRARLLQLQYKICSLTGEDPLLMYPRNCGSLSTQLDQMYVTPKAITREKHRPTFQSYVPSKRDDKPTSHNVPVLVVRNSDSTKPSTSNNERPLKIDQLLEFDDNYFGNSLEKVGSISWKKVEENNSSHIRIAPPPPPTRPARSPKPEKSRQENIPTGNLIDL